MEETIRLRLWGSIYEMNKKDIWKFFAFFAVSIIPLMFSVLKFVDMRISFIVSIIFLILVLIVGKIAFIRKREII